MEFNLPKQTWGGIFSSIEDNSDSGSDVTKLKQYVLLYNQNQQYIEIGI